MGLTRSTDPLVWIDCEMTGLNPNKDRILQISCLLTAASLTPLEPTGYTAVIHTPLPILSAMDDWCTATHTSTGLIAACLSSTTTADQAASALLAYIKSHIPTPRTALLAGNSVHADRAFLAHEPWAPILEHLHYRLFDVSAMKEAARRWSSEDVLAGVPEKAGVHEARADIRESIAEARFYRDVVFGWGGRAEAGGRGGEDLPPIEVTERAPRRRRLNGPDKNADQVADEAMAAELKAFDEAYKAGQATDPSRVQRVEEEEKEEEKVEEKKVEEVGSDRGS